MQAAATRYTPILTVQRMSAQTAVLQLSGTKVNNTQYKYRPAPGQIDWRCGPIQSYIAIISVAREINQFDPDFGCKAKMRVACPLYMYVWTEILSVCYHRAIAHAIARG